MEGPIDFSEAPLPLFGIQQKHLSTNWLCVLRKRL